jgi:hypothetical protein
MLLTFLLVMAGACALSLAASVLMAWASNRSALWNMMFAVVFLLAVLAGVLLIAFLLTQTAFPN